MVEHKSETKASDHKSTKVEAHPSPTHSPKQAKEVPSTRTGPYDGLIELSDMAIGETGWLLLGPDGIPTILQRDVPDVGVPATAVRVQDTHGGKFDGLVTISGAPLSDGLNAHPDVRVVTAVPPVVQTAKGKSPTA